MHISAGLHPELACLGTQECGAVFSTSTVRKKIPLQCPRLRSSFSANHVCEFGRQSLINIVPTTLEIKNLGERCRQQLHTARHA